MPDAEPTTSPVDERAPVRWGFGDAAAGWVVAQFGGMLASSLVLAIKGLEPDQLDDLSLGWVAVAQLGLWLGLLGVPWLATELKGNGLVRDLRLRFARSDAWVGALWGLVSQWGILVLYLPAFWLTSVDVDEFNAPARALSDKATDAVGVVLLVLIVGLGAPIVEEIFYRGLMQRSLVRRLGRVPGIVVTAVIFGASHFEWLQFPALTAFGLVLGYLADRYERLGPAVVAHMVFNLAAVVSLVSGS
ncbi:MAG TPA: CPBP family intramembrane glutamic endopeptidase [Acidimicrobiales bacterium]